jgi:hypothetical protein
MGILVLPMKEGRPNVYFVPRALYQKVGQLQAGARESGKREGKKQEAVKEKQPTITIHGFYHKHIRIDLVENKQTGNDDFFFKFIIGQRRGAAVAWIPVAMRGTAAEKFCNLVMSQTPTSQDVFSFTGKWQEKETRRGKPVRELWAFGARPAGKKK